MSRYRTAKIGADGSIPDPPSSGGPPEERPDGDCPTCGGETDNGSEGGDEDGRTWDWEDCDLCAAQCASCSEIHWKTADHTDKETICDDCKPGEAALKLATPK